VPWLELKAVPPPRPSGLSAKLATNHPARRQTRKVFRGLNNTEQGPTSAARCPDTEEVTGSNPVSPTSDFPTL